MDGVRDTVLRGFGITFLTVAMIELLPEAFRVAWNAREARLFRRFVGRRSSDDSISLVYGGRTIDAENHHHLRPTLMPKASEAANAVPEGVEEWFAQEDIRASAYLYEEFSRRGLRVKLAPASRMTQKLEEFSSVSIGLGFNALTERLSLHQEQELFAVGWKKLKKSGELTDYIRFKHQTPQSPQGQSLALVARVIGGDGCIHFVAAGNTAQGTAVAGRYLAEHWKTLAKLYKKPRTMRTDSLAVLVSHPIGDVDPSDGDRKGRVVAESVRWWPIVQGQPSK